MNISIILLLITDFNQCKNILSSGWVLQAYIRLFWWWLDQHWRGYKWEITWLTVQCLLWYKKKNINMFFIYTLRKGNSLHCFFDPFNIFWKSCVNSWYSLCTSGKKFGQKNIDCLYFSFLSTHLAVPPDTTPISW